MNAFIAVVDAPPRRRKGEAPGRPVPPMPPPPGGGDGAPGGERRAPLLDNARLATLFLISAEVMLFAGLISGFFVLRLAAPVWPPALQPRLPVAVTAANTLVLLASSATMLLAGRALRQRDVPTLVRSLVATAALGTLFLGVQGFEWARLIRFGLTVSSGAYGGTFYTLIGTHAAHVAGALLWLLATLASVARGRFSPERPGIMRACAMYWHFVVLVWPILYLTVYLL